MPSGNVQPVIFSFEGAEPGSTRGILTVKAGSVILFMDNFDLAKAKGRKDFIDKFVRKHPEYEPERESMDGKMLGIAQRELARHTSEPSCPENHEPLEQSRVELRNTPRQLIIQAKQFLKSPGLMDKISQDIHAIGVTGEDELAITLYLIGTSRLLPRPLAGLIRGESSAGKSYIIQIVADLFPDETVLKAHRLSPQALQYMPQDSLVHRFVVAGERSRATDDGAASDATRALREMISDGKLSAAVAMKSSQGSFETHHIQQDGPIAYVESTTLAMADVFKEDRNRCLHLLTDESPGQTQQIIRDLARVAANPGTPSRNKEICKLHHTAQRLFKAGDVVIPFAERLVRALPSECLQARRAFPQLLSLIKAIALLHQFQREKDEHGRVIATVEDYSFVRNHLTAPLSRSLGTSVSPGAAYLLNVVQAFPGPFTVSEVMAQVEHSENTVRTKLRELVQSRQVIVGVQGQGPHGTRYAVPDSAPPLDAVTLPDLAGNQERGVASG